MNYYYVIYKFVGSDSDCSDGHYHEDFFDWVRFGNCPDVHHALERFWRYEEGGTDYYIHRDHKKDFKILDIRRFETEDEIHNFVTSYWAGNDIYEYLKRA